MTKTALERYHVRMRRVVDYIDRHLDDDLGLETLSGVAAFSKHHFHRQFTATFGVSVHRYVRLARMKRASYQLAFRDGETVTDIAMDAGYDAPEAFARAFRECVGQSPSAFRKCPDWEPWFAAFGSFNSARTMQMKSYTGSDVKIVDVAAISVALMEHRGNPARIGETIQRFVAWRRMAGLVPKTSATFTVFHDPEPTRPEDFHVDLCVGTDRSVSAGDHGVKGGVIPGGRCAVLRVIGPSDDLSAPANFLYRDWLPGSGTETRDFPLYCQRISFSPDVPEHEAVTDLFLPLR
jgi:AraC family transcriptional regulator